MNVTSPRPTPPEPEELEQARVLMREKRYAEAIRCLTPMIKSMRLDAPRSEEIIALIMMADSQLLSGQPTDAYKNFVVASELAPTHTIDLERSIFQCLHKMPEPIISPKFEAHLVQFLADARVDNNSLERIGLKLLKTKFQIDNEDSSIEFSSILTDAFLPAALSNLILADARTELFLTQVRHHIFNLAIESDLAEELQPLVIAFAEHAEKIEYAFDIEDSERVVLLGIKALLETEIDTETDLQQQLGPLILYAMYEPIGTLSFSDKIFISNLDDWPAELQPLLKKTFNNRRVEQSLRESIGHLGNVTQEVSKKVMGLYEKNPYPRWENTFDLNKKLSYLAFNPVISPWVRNPKKFERQLKCLVAGSGTGQHPLQLAASCKDISITALDLSLPSLCYGKRKAVESGIDNVEFVQGDILQLDSMDETFDVIECSGVLHHMEIPEDGLQALLGRLRSHGLLRIGLYSRTARDAMGINRARVDNLDPTLEDIRTTRSLYLQNPDEFENMPRDFYSTSECRDLLYHVQEHQYDLTEIKALLERNSLEFLGFNPMPNSLLAAFKNRFGPDSDARNLDDWHTFEQENPLIFKGMYQFHCQKSE